MELIYLFSGAALGLLAGWFMAKALQKNNVDDSQALRIQIEGLKLSEADKKIQLEQEKEEHKAKQIQFEKVSQDLARQENINANLEEKLKEHKSELEELQKKFSFEFENLAQRIFEEKSKKFTDQNKSNIGELLNPLKERIEKFEEKVEKSSKESMLWNTALKEQIINLKELNQAMTKEAESLTKALKGDSKAQGNWGEMQLEAILEKVGLQKDVHYFKEKNYKNEEGLNQRLDYIIKLPDDKYLILDSKVSLTAYSQYFETDDEIEQAKYLKNHTESINNHIKTLSEKNYQNLYEINQPDYVLMFIANEPALSIALKRDMELYEKAMDKNIVLVSTSTLMATLRTISYIWKQDLQNKNAFEIARQAGDMYDKFVAFTEDLKDVGKNIERTQNSYRESMKKLVEGKGNLVRRAELLKDLGAKSTKQMDQRILNRTEE